MSLPTTLVMIETDPRTSARPAEAIRIAAGIGVWKKTDVTLLLRGPVAGYSLQEYADELVDEDNFTRYLPLVAESPRPILSRGFVYRSCRAGKARRGNTKLSRRQRRPS